MTKTKLQKETIKDIVYDELGSILALTGNEPLIARLEQREERIRLEERIKENERMVNAVNEAIEVNETPLTITAATMVKSGCLLEIERLRQQLSKLKKKRIRDEDEK